MATLKVAIDAREAKSGAAEFETATGKMTRGAREATKATDSMQGKIDALGPAATKLKLAFAAAGASITAAFALNQARQAIGGYEQVLANLRAVTGSTREEMARFDETARELGSTTSFRPEEVAQGLLNLAKAGFTAEQAIGSIRGSLDLATAGEVSLSEATDTVAATLAQFRLGIGASSRVANTLVIAANASMASVQGVGEAMKYAGPLAAALGVSMEDAAAAIGVLANAGIQGSLAGTNLRGIMASLINPSKEAEAIFKRLGISVADVDIRSNGLVGALTNLKNAGAGPKELETVFGKLNVSAAIALGSMSQGFADIQRQIREGTTAAHDQAAIMGDTLPGAFKKLGATIESVWIKLGDSGLGGAMRSAVDFANDLIRALAGIETPGRAVSTAVEQTAIAIKAATAGLTAFVALQAATKFYEFGTAVLFSGNAFAKLNVLMAKNPIGLIAVAIALAVAAFLEFKDEVISVGDEVTTFGDIVFATWEFVKEATVEAWKGLVDLLAGVWNWIREKWADVTGWIAKKWGELTEGLGVNWTKVFETILDVLKRVANIIIGTFVSIARILGTLVDTVVRAAKAIGDFDFTSPGKSLEAIGDALSPKRIFEEAKDKVKDAYATDYVGAVVQSVTNAFKAAVPEIQNAAEIVGFVIEQSRKEILRRAVERTKTKTDEQDRLKRLREEAEKARNSMQDLGRAAVDTGDGINATADAADEASKKIQQLREEIEKEIAALEREASFRDLGSDAFAREVAIADFRERAMKAEVKNVDELVAHYAELYDSTRRAAAQRDERERVQEQLADMRNELELVGLLNDEREREAGVFALTKAAKHLDAEETARLAEEYRELTKQLQEARAIKQVADNIADSFGSAFEDVILGTKSVGEAFRALFLDIQKELLRAIVLRPLVGSISGGLQSFFGGAGLGSLFASADGNAFDNGRVVRYSRGAGHVTGGPEYFPLHDGRTGVRGESGAEGVLPLKRLANGDLGVQSDGGGPSTTVVNFTVYASDADSFRKSQRQIAADLRRATGGGFSA